jgi:uroporphyrinogen-III synthase
MTLDGPLGGPLDGPLDGRRILITRPIEQARELSVKLRAKGAIPIEFPAIEIAPPADLFGLRRELARLGDFDLAIFVSPTAVDAAFGHISAWPVALPAAVVGPASAQALIERGVVTVLAPIERYDSEGLLARGDLQTMSGQQVIIFRGGAGRELLGDTFTRRGARVTYANCYQRRLPSIDPSDFLQQWAEQGLHAANFTSSEGLTNFITLVGAAGVERLVQLPVFVSHPRVAAVARAHGIEQIHMTGVGEPALVDALEAFFR